MEYQPALDGLRALAVVAVIVFHADLGVVTGGYVGVSVFFTLSGFLITSLLHTEVERTGRVDVSAFLARRARRLLPASMLCLLGVAVAARAGLLDGVTHLHRDLLGSALQIQNWVLLASGESYADLLLNDAGRASPLEHYWSLAIEEQFYWVWPFAFAALAALSGRGRTRALAGLAVVAALAAPVVARVWGPDAAYWASPARLAEILFGAWLALAIPSLGAAPLRRWWAPLGLGAVIVTAVAAPADSSFLYGGGLPVFALASTLLIAGLQSPGPVRSILSLGPLVGVGRISYGLYLYHWPVFVILDEPRVGAGGLVLFLVRIGVTVAIAVASYFVVERPIRFATRTPRRTLVAAGAALVTVVGVSLVVPPRVDDQYWQVAPATIGTAPVDDVPLEIPSFPIDTTDAGTPAVASPGDSEPSSPEPRAEAPSVVESSPGEGATRPWHRDQAPPTPARPVRVLVVGDSTARATANGLEAFAASHPELLTVSVVWSAGFGFLQTGTVVRDPGSDDPFGEAAVEARARRLPDAIAQFRPDVVMVMVSVRDLEARVWSDDEGPLDPTHPDFRVRLTESYSEVTGDLLRAGATVAWVRPPWVDPYWLGRPAAAADSPQRTGWEQGLVEAIAGTDERVHLVDLRAWAEETGVAVDRAARPDGIHWTPEQADELAFSWLAPHLVELALIG